MESWATFFLGRGAFCFFTLLNGRHHLVHLQGMRSFGWGSEVVVQHNQSTRRTCFNLIQREKPLFILQVQFPELSQVTQSHTWCASGAPPSLQLTYESPAAWQEGEMLQHTPHWYIKARLWCSFSSGLGDTFLLIFGHRFKLSESTEWVCFVKCPSSMERLSNFILECSWLTVC